MAEKKTPKWGSPEFKKAVSGHDKRADPKREAEGHRFTKKPEKQEEKEEK